MMEKEEFEIAMKRLADFFAKNLSDNQKQVWFDYVKEETIENFKEAIEELILSERYFPMPVILLGKLREIKNRKEAIATKYVPKVITEKTEKDSEYTRRAKEIAHKILFNTQDWEANVDDMIAMDNEYPGRGWRDAAHRITARNNEKLGIEVPDFLKESELKSVQTTKASSCFYVSARGHACSNIGVISHSTTGGNFYCREHYK